MLRFDDCFLNLLLSLDIVEILEPCVQYFSNSSILLTFNRSSKELTFKMV